MTFHQKAEHDGHPLSGGGQKGGLFLMKERGLYLGAGMTAENHATHAIKVYIAIHGCFHYRLSPSGKWTYSRAVLIAPDQLHQIASQHAMLGYFVLTPETSTARRLLQGFSHLKPCALSARVVNSVLPRLRRYLDHGCSSDEAVEVCDDLFCALVPPSSSRSKMDSRIESTLEYLRRAADYRVPIPEIAEAVSLSPSRLSHLFHEQMGISLNRYLLWRRLRAALDEMAVCRSLTEVAHQAGFADSAHLSRTFSQMFGQPPSAFFRNSRIIRTDL